MILETIVILIYIVKSLDLLYLFQIKEYRFDRFYAFVQEETPLKILYLRRIRMPKISIRNLLIVQGILVNIIPLYLFLKSLHIGFLILLIIFGPVFAFLTMLLGVLISEVPVQIYRKIVTLIAAEKVKHSKAVFIGITGSYGKTTTKEFLYQILKQKYKVAKTDKNYNSEMGIAISVLKNLKSDTEYFIAELGAYRKGEIKAACKIIHPKIGIITGIGNQHLSLFGSKKNLVAAKAELFEALPKDGKAYLNQDIEQWKSLADKTVARIRFYSTKDQPEGVNIEKIQGKPNIQNILPCIYLSQDLGLENSLITNAIANLKPILGRLSQEIGINGATILNDSYNSNVEGFLAALNMADQMAFKKKYILSRGMIELGDEKRQSYKEIVDELNKSDLILLTTDKLFKEFGLKNKVRTFQNEMQLLDYIKEKVDKKTLIVVEGRFEPNIIMSLRGGGTTTKQSR